MDGSWVPGREGCLKNQATEPPFGASCAGHADDDTVLGACGRRAMAHRLATRESGFVTQWLWAAYWYSASGHPLQWFPYFETRKCRTGQKQSFDN